VEGESEFMLDPTEPESLAPPIMSLPQRALPLNHAECDRLDAMLSRFRREHSLNNLQVNARYGATVRDANPRARWTALP
jgi:hypothetical protein